MTCVHAHDAIPLRNCATLLLLHGGRWDTRSVFGNISWLIAKIIITIITRKSFKMWTTRGKMGKLKTFSIIIFVASAEVAV